jgi:hypothetical protein
VTVFLAEVTDRGAAGLEDAQAKETEHRDQRKVVDVRRSPRGGDQSFELQVAQPEGG